MTEALMLGVSRAPKMKAGRVRLPIFSPCGCELELAWETMSLRLLISRIVSSRTSMTFLFLTVSGSTFGGRRSCFSSNDPKKERKKERRRSASTREVDFAVGRARPPSPDLVPSLRPRRGGGRLERLCDPSSQNLADGVLPAQRPRGGALRRGSTHPPRCRPDLQARTPPEGLVPLPLLKLLPFPKVLRGSGPSVPWVVLKRLPARGPPPPTRRRRRRRRLHHITRLALPLPARQQHPNTPLPPGSGTGRDEKKKERERERESPSPLASQPPTAAVEHKRSSTPSRFTLSRSALGHQQARFLALPLWRPREAPVAIVAIGGVENPK